MGGGTKGMKKNMLKIDRANGEGSNLGSSSCWSKVRSAVGMDPEIDPLPESNVSDGVFPSVYVVLLGWVWMEAGRQ